MRVKGILVNNELFISCEDLRAYIKKEMELDMVTPGKTYSKFAKKMLRILNNFQKNSLTNESECDIIKET